MPAPTGYDPSYGGIPNLPAYTTDTQSTTGTDKLGQLIAGQPGFMANLGAYTGNVASEQAGQVSAGTTAQLGQQAAERGIGSGMPMSQAASTGFLARYGLTSEALTQQGGKDYLSLMAQWPYQDQQTTQTTHDLGAERAVYAAAPVPSAAAAAALRAAQQGIGAGRGSVATPTGGGGPVAATAPTSGMGWGGGGVTPTSAWNQPSDPWANATETWAGTTSSPYSTGQSPGLYPESQYGLPTWQDTGNLMGYSLPDLQTGNQPTSQGSMYVSPQDQWYSDELSNFASDWGM